MIGETVQRKAFTGEYTTDSHGKRYPQRAEPVPVVQAAFAPESSTEVDGQTVINKAALYFDGDQGGHPLDQWIIRDVTYHQNGWPAVWRSPYTGRTGTEIKLDRVTG